MRIIVYFVVFLFPVAAMAQNVSLPLADIEHAVTFLRMGGSYLEGRDLAAKLTFEAQAQIDKMNAVTKEPPTMPPPADNPPKKD